MFISRKAFLFPLPEKGMGRICCCGYGEGSRFPLRSGRERMCLCGFRKRSPPSLRRGIEHICVRGCGERSRFLLLSGRGHMFLCGGGRRSRLSRLLVWGTHVCVDVGSIRGSPHRGGEDACLSRC